MITRSVMYKLAPLLELVGLAVAEVAKDETTKPIGLMLWMGGQDETADSRLQIHHRAAAESWHSEGDGRQWTGTIVRPTASGVNVQCTQREAV